MSGFFLKLTHYAGWKKTFSVASDSSDKKLSHQMKNRLIPYSSLSKLEVSERKPLSQFLYLVIHKLNFRLE